MSLDAQPRDYTRGLHSDLILCVLDRLAQPDVLAVATASRHWRTIARNHQNFYFHKALVFDPNSSPAFSVALADFCFMLAFVVKNNLRASVAADYFSVPLVVTNEVEPSDRMAAMFDPKNVERVVNSVRMMDAIIAAVPFLVKLRIEWGPIHPEGVELNVFSKLVRPAPYLRELDLAMHLPADADEDDLPRIPDALFGGRAPALQRLRLKCFRFRDSTVPAFTSVRTLEFDPPRYLQAASRICPKLRDLTVGYVKSMSKVNNLSQLHSLSLCVTSDNTGLPLLFQTLEVVPRVTIACDFQGPNSSVPFGSFIGAFPLDTPLRLELLLHGDGTSLSISVSTLNRDAERTFILMTTPPSMLLVLLLSKQLEVVRSRHIVEIHVHPQLFNGISFFFPRGIPELRTLRISWPQNITAAPNALPYFALMDPAASMSSICCPNLEVFELLDPLCRPDSEIAARKLSVIKPGQGRVRFVIKGVSIYGTLAQVGEKFLVHATAAEERKLRATERMYVSREKFENLDPSKCVVQ
ncbi:hypothetical protein EXIGLDRAFT_717075 [Exidia glandulosa HHB12029]|uniref:F-box domain-containing protein n=1 Tax=Exidia glandulosa HHB12029 TaxID=1314781 RepID=A0A165IJ73_EXIGL|nr:hypothetical protein EXIGLDRAFT_717075 [Exidia glandulosa HHB12029]